MLDTRHLIGIGGWVVSLRTSVSMLVVAITIAFMPSCATSAGGPGTDIGSLIEALREDYLFPFGFDLPPQPTPAMAALVDAGDETIPALIRELKHAKSDTHWSAVVLVLGWIGNRRAVDPMMASWEARTWRFRNKARKASERLDVRLIEALGDIGGDRAAEALALMYAEACTPARTSYDARWKAVARSDIVESLVKAGGKPAVAPLIHALTVVEGEHYNARELALETLRKWFDGLEEDFGYDSLKWWDYWQNFHSCYFFHRSRSRFIDPLIGSERGLAVIFEAKPDSD